MDGLRTMLEFHERFPDEEACWRALRRVRWPRGFVCPRCGGRGSHFLEARRLEQCRGCRYQASVTAGTVFHKTRVPLRVWFLGIFYLARHKKGISALQFQRDTGLGSYQTAWMLLHKLRSALEPRPKHRLRGDVEVDETYVGPRRIKGNLGRAARYKVTVAAAVERRAERAGALRLAVVPDASWESLGPFVRGVIDGAETTLHTDAWQGYRRFRSVGLQHRPLIQGTPARGPEILPWVHRVFSNLKTWLRGTFHGVSHKHLQHYLDEFTYRFDRRWNENGLFRSLLRRAILGNPLPYYRLVAEQAG